mmetsp:Transcript_21782/g.56047  ORF Transcript_21782/g.56047 Transcript_21782/m.56047 type:complete len:92 (+) Transcript_21782:166-441(+)
MNARAAVAYGAIRRRRVSHLWPSDEAARGESTAHLSSLEPEQQLNIDLAGGSRLAGVSPIVPCARRRGKRLFELPLPLPMLQVPELRTGRS